MTESGAGASSDVLAALDCGTNSTRLLVVGGDGEILDRQMRVTRLGEGVDTTRKLSAEAIERTIAVLRDYRKSMDAHGVVRARMAATSAARDATNSSEFLTAAKEVTGVDPEILSGESEGRLSFRGATSDLAQTGDSPEMVVDIGGGSTEIVVGVPGRDDSLEVLSLNIGCVRVTERFFSSDPPGPDQLKDARFVISEALTEARDALRPLEAGGRVIGLAGTVSTLGSMAKGVASYERDKVHHSVLTAEQVDWWLNALASETSSERSMRPGMDPGRADVIVGGVLILSEVMSVFDRTTCLVSEADILDGLVASLR
jgi:exopolyphosphatase/guanosine-5'-triphosphate,3'-diphosphate pyrophosphatase